jgi:hypothetical protein
LILHLGNYFLAEGRDAKLKPEAFSGELFPMEGDIQSEKKFVTITTTYPVLIYENYVDILTISINVGCWLRRTTLVFLFVTRPASGCKYTLTYGDGGWLFGQAKSTACNTRTKSAPR